MAWQRRSNPPFSVVGVVTSLLVAACGARTAPGSGDAAASDAGRGVAEVDAAPRAGCTLRCTTRPLARGFPLPGSWSDVARTTAGWLVVQGSDAEDRRLHVALIASGGGVLHRTTDFAIRVGEPRVAWDGPSAVAMVLFREGLVWVDPSGASVAPVVVTSADEVSRGGRGLGLGGEFLVWTGDHVASSMDSFETARVAPLADSIRWEAVDESVGGATVTPDFERFDDGLVGSSRKFNGRRLLLSWMDPEGRRLDTVVVDEPGSIPPGTVDRMGEDVAVLGGRVAVLRATTMVRGDRRARTVVLDVVERDGEIERAVVETTLDPLARPRILETLDGTVVAVHRGEGGTSLSPLLGECADTPSLELAPGRPRFFDTFGDVAVLLTEDSDAAGTVYEVRCGAE